MHTYTHHTREKFLGRRVSCFCSFIKTVKSFNMKYCWIEIAYVEHGTANTTFPHIEPFLLRNFSRIRYTHTSIQFCTCISSLIWTSRDSNLLRSQTVFNPVKELVNFTRMDCKKRCHCTINPTQQSLTFPSLLYTASLAKVYNRKYCHNIFWDEIF